MKKTKLCPPQTSSKSSEKHQQTDIVQAFLNPPYDKNNCRWIDITNAMTVFLCKDMVPFLTGEKSSFQL